MRWGPKAITALLALACAGGAACGSGGGHDTTTIITRTSFPQGFLPVLLAGSGGSGDVVIRDEGDLYAVAGTSDVISVARADGTVATFANDVGGASTILLSIALGSDGRLFAGDDAGRIWVISANGSSAALLVDTGSEPITGLALAPDGFGDLGGSLLAAAGTAGILRITTGDTPAFTALANPGDRYVDLAFSGGTLFAIDATNAEIDTVGADGTAASFQSGFDTPVGMAVDSTASEIYVADAGDDVLYTVPVSGGAPTARAAYPFDSAAPSGLAYDGLAALAFVTADPPAIRGSNLPRIDPANPNFGLLFSGTTVGYGDLELDRTGAFVLAANDPDDPPAGDSINNFLFSVSRDAATVTALASGVGSPLEELLGVAVDPKQQVIYFSTRRGNVYRRASDGTGTDAPFVSVTNGVPVMGLELAPPGFAGFGGWLFATTGIDTVDGTGEMFAIDPESPNPPVQITLSQPVSHLSDLVFSTDGVLYLVDNNTSTSRILRVAVTGTTGTVTVLAGPSVQLGLADGIEIDEGGDRLLVASETAGGGQLLAVDRDSGAVTALANISIDDGFFPTGVVYDRLGTAVVRERNDATSLRAHSVAP